MSDPSKVSMRILGEAADFIGYESEARLPNETGGIVLGTMLDNTITVTHAVGPGPKAQHQPSRFMRDGAFAQEVMGAIVQETEGRVEYLGEWHSHPKPAAASGCDSNSLRWISRNLSYARPEPLLVICHRTRRKLWRVEGYIWRGNDLVRLEIIE